MKQIVFARRPKLYRVVACSRAFGCLKLAVNY